MNEGRREIGTDVLIVGAGCGGVGAALALLDAGVGCVLTDPTAMVGGQLSSQGVPPDENPWIEGGGPGAPAAFRGCNASYARFRERIRCWYRDHGGLQEVAARDPRLNPGGGWVSRLCFEPRLADAILEGMLREADGGRGLLTVLRGAEPMGADVERDRVRSVSFEQGGRTVEVRAGFVLDATDLGDVLELARVEHAIGAEGTHVYGEQHARDDLPPGVDHDPLDQQAITWCFAVEHVPGGCFVESEPPGYDAWRTHVPEMTPPWTGRLFDWTVPSHDESGSMRLPLVPWPDAPPAGELELWRYRRVVDGSIHADDRPDVSLCNAVQMDYWQWPLLGVSQAERAKAVEDAKTQAACFLHWMRTEASRHDGAGEGYPGLRLRGDVLGSEDGFALAPYIREPRRLVARRMLTEAHVGAEQRGIDACDDAAPLGRGEPFEDSVAIGHYPIDLHPSCAGRNSVYVQATPFRVPLAALVPERVRNVIAAGKCLGVSHVANGCTRTHPVEWAVGEAAGVLAATSVQDETEPQAVCDRADRVRIVQRRLAERGAPLGWPWEPETGGGAG